LASDRISKPGYVNPFTGKNKGVENSRFIPTIWEFENIKTGEILQLTQYEFSQKYKFDRGAISRLVRKIYRTHKGWKVNYSS
jgi:hypothetical protein